MRHSLLTQVPQSVVEIQDDRSQLGLRERDFASDAIVEAALIAEFCDNVAVPFWE